MNLQPAEKYRNRPRSADAWIINNLLKRENLGFMVGRPKRAYKSWLLLDASIALARHEPLWGCDAFTAPSPIRVAYFSQEDAEDDIQDRLQILYKNRSPAPGDANLWMAAKNFSYALDSNAGFEHIRIQINGMINAFGVPDLIIFDTLRRINYSDENDSTAMTAMLQNVEKIIQSCHCSIIFAHHTRKGSAEDLVDESDPSSARGSTALFGASDLFINVQPKGPAQVELSFTTKRTRAPEPLSLTLDLKQGIISPSQGAAMSQQVHTKNGFAYVDDAAMIAKILGLASPFTQQDIINALNINSHSVPYRLIKLMTAAGQIEEVGTGVWALKSTP